jgi:myb proto-oncogene protein
VIQGTYLKKDDPKIIALMQQAELLSSLAHKVNTENTDQSLENAWKVLQDFLNQGKDSDILGYKITEMDFQIEDFKDLIEDLRSSNEGSQSSWRQPGLYEDSPQSSEYSTGSTLISHKTVDKADENQSEVCMVHEDIEAELKSPNIGEPGLGECGTEIPIQDVLPNSDEVKIDDGIACELPNTEFSSPYQVTPLFTSMAAGIPSPQFSESERHFLLKTLGMESSSPDPRPRSSKPPPCKRILLNSL